MDFIIDYWPKDKNYIIEAIDELIDDLQSDEKSWTIYSLLNYLNTIYTIVKKTINVEPSHQSNKQCKSVKSKSDYIIVEAYSIFNTGLINKRGEYIYFIKETTDSPQKENYFLTINEIREIEGLKDTCELKPITNKLKEAFLDIQNQILKDSEFKIDINIEENEDSQKLKEVKKKISELNDNIKKLKNELKNIRNSLNLKEEEKTMAKEEKEKILETLYEEIKELKDQLKTDRFDSGWHHIIIDGCDNLPLPIINAVIGHNYSYIDKGNIKYKIIENEKLYNCFKNILIRSINRSMSKAKRNITLIVPYFYPNDKKKDRLTSYLIPLYLMHSYKPDCALVFNKEENRYVGTTLLSIEEASLNIRSFGNLEQFSWLKE